MSIENSFKTIVARNTPFAIQHAVVTANSFSPNVVSIRLMGATNVLTGIRYVSSYSPTVGDVVLCMINRNDIFVLGKLA